MPWQTLKLGWLLFRKNFEVVLQPSSTRLLITDGLAALTAAWQIIGFESDNEGIAARYKNKTDTFYTQMLLLPAACYFEFDRSRFFFESVLAQHIELNGPSFSINNPDKEGIVIFPGAGVFKRSWEADKFLALIKQLMQHTQQTIYLAGGPGEEEAGRYLMTNLSVGNITNLINKTSLPQLIELIAGASLVIGNETSAIHIAAAVKTKAVCILGGGHFGRFAPYPAYINNAPLCVYQKMECFNCNWECIYQTAKQAPFPCIANVIIDEVATTALQQLAAI
ncbi:glycosyltransferase family 9 protein [Mucilaginibacter sp.]|uniref:glycosyltransferase family 9 protein n=1 Tax=Mucilaginibacter sp. TaxID=1882438 RepID=UPI003D134F11